MSDENNQNEKNQTLDGAIITENKNGRIHCLSIIGQIEGHYMLPEGQKATKYDHVIPTLVALEESDKIDGILILINTLGGDVEAGLAIAELIYHGVSIEELYKITQITPYFLESIKRIVDMEEKPAEPKSNWCCPPFYYYTREDAAFVKKGIESGCGVDAPGSYIAWLCKKTEVYAMQMPGKRYDIGNLESYEQVKKDYKGIKKC